MDWKTYTRHPLSANYPDITGKDWEDFVNNLREHGLTTWRAITIKDGMILDGWQLYRACLEVGIEPPFCELPDHYDKEKYVETSNDYRRHESPEVRMARLAQRRERVARKVLAGETIKNIAKSEGVSPTTVTADIDRIRLDSQPAPQQQVAEAVASIGESSRDRRKALCQSCQRAARVGNSPLRGCPDCKEARLSLAEEVDAEESTEAITARVNAEIESVCRQLMSAMEALPASKWLEDKGRRDSALEKVKNACHTLRSAKCTHGCPACHGEGCDHCFGSGVVPTVVYQQLA